eukprot:m.1214861 g.1214861  ORF g.1214861 m.1214861 type:complete len:55 (+) comp24606_c0_seq16:824-988(+)
MDRSFAAADEQGDSRAVDKSSYTSDYVSPSQILPPGHVDDVVRTEWWCNRMLSA